jgi:hypothetical protein
MVEQPACVCPDSVWRVNAELKPSLDLLKVKPQEGTALLLSGDDLLESWLGFRPIGQVKARRFKAVRQQALARHAVDPIESRSQTHR